MRMKSQRRRTFAAPAFSTVLFAVLSAGISGPLAALGASAAHVQSSDPADEQQPEPIERLDTWPQVGDKARVDKDILRLRKASTVNMGTQARDALLADGASVAPKLLVVLGKEQDPKALERVTEVLTAVVDARHTRLLAEEFDHRSRKVRNWTLECVSGYPDPGVRSAAEEALAVAAKSAEKKDKKDPKGQVRELYLASLCVTSSGSLEGLPRLLERAQEHWIEDGPAMRKVLEIVRGAPATALAVDALGASERRRKLAGLNLLAGCGGPGAVEHVRAFLDETDRGLQLAAINALRGVVDRDPPLEKLPVFEMIEQAKAWKSRL